MEIKVNRFKYGEHSTLGRFFINGAAFCYSLEDKVRSGPKVQRETAIPAGTYNVIVDMSTRFGREMPLVQRVPNFTGIRIHAGNTDADTDGCILLGMEWDNENHISDSKTAFNAVFEQIKAARQNNEAVTLYVHDV